MKEWERKVVPKLEDEVLFSFLVTKFDFRLETWQVCYLSHNLGRNFCLCVGICTTGHSIYVNMSDFRMKSNIDYPCVFPPCAYSIRVISKTIFLLRRLAIHSPDTPNKILLHRWHGVTSINPTIWIAWICQRCFLFFANITLTLFQNGLKYFHRSVHIILWKTLLVIGKLVTKCPLRPREAL